MPKQNNITLADGKATPVQHTFQPISVANGRAEWAEPSSDGSLTKRNTLAAVQKLPGKGRSSVTEQTELALPYVVTEVVNGVPREIVHSYVRVITTVVSHPEVPKAIVKDGRVLNANLQLHADIAAAFDDRVGFS